MTTAEAETNFDPFEEETSTTNADDAASNEEEENDATETSETSKEETDDNEDTTATSADGEGEKTEDAAAAKSEKMIPESRLKAAISDVQKKLDEANRRLAEHEKIPVPDKDVDPEGHAFYVRMETSRELMREVKPDYDEVIAHYTELARANPLLDEAVYKHAVPAKLAYDIAKRDLEIKDLEKLKGSDEYKQFQEWKRLQSEGSKQEDAAPASKLSKQVTNGLSKVPNLNRNTDVSTRKAVAKNAAEAEVDDLFAGAL